MITHNEDFKDYIKGNLQKMRSVVNNASKFEDGAPSGVTYFKTKKLHYKYESIEKIKTGTRKINASQERAIVKAYSKFKGVKDSVFYERNLYSNPTIHNAVKKNRRRNKDDDSDVYQT